MKRLIAIVMLLVSSCILNEPANIITIQRRTDNGAGIIAYRVDGVLTAKHRKEAINLLHYYCPYDVKILNEERKTEYFFADRDAFMLDLAYDIQKAIRFAERKGLTPVFRLNGTSDLSWEKYEVPVFCTKNIFELFPNVQFYDYTKVLGRKVKDIHNYHLTFSKADGNDSDVAEALLQGMSVVAVYDKIPEGVPSADETDLRFLDPKGIMLGLKAKGRAKKDYSGFVIRLTEVA
jgi:hypothetical protein